MVEAIVSSLTPTDRLDLKKKFEFFAGAFLEDVRRLVLDSKQNSNHLDGLKMHFSSLLTTICSPSLLSVSTDNDPFHSDPKQPSNVSCVVYDLDNRPRLCAIFTQQPNSDSGRVRSLIPALNWMLHGSSAHSPCFVIELNATEGRVLIGNYMYDSNKASNIPKHLHTPVIRLSPLVVAVLAMVKTISLSITSAVGAHRRTPIPIKECFSDDLLSVRSLVVHKYGAWPEDSLYNASLDEEERERERERERKNDSDFEEEEEEEEEGDEEGEEGEEEQYEEEDE